MSSSNRTVKPVSDTHYIEGGVLGILGTGAIARTMAAEFAKVPAFHCAAVCSRQKATGEALAQSFGIPKVYTDLDAMLADPDRRRSPANAASRRGIMKYRTSPPSSPPRTMTPAIRRWKRPVRWCRSSRPPGRMHSWAFENSTANDKLFSVFALAKLAETIYNKDESLNS